MLRRRVLRRFALGARFDAEKDYYRVLGVPPAAGKEQVRKAYIALVKRFHPDKGGQGDARIKEINEANGVLSDEGLRAEYDQARAGAAKPAAAGPRSYQAYRDGGEYANPFRGQQHARRGEPDGGAHHRAGRPPPNFDDLLREFARQFNAAQSRAQPPPPPPPPPPPEQSREYSARQASPEWPREEFDFQRMQREKEERARRDLLHTFEQLLGAWRVFRASAARRGVWRGLLDAFLHYRSNR